MHGLRPGQQPLPRGRGRLVAGEALEHGKAAAVELIGDEAVGAGADHLADLLEGIGVGQPLRHDEGQRRVDRAQRRGQHREGPLQAVAQAPVVQRHQLLRQGVEILAHRAALGPALQAGDRVLGQDALVVVEADVVAQRDGGDLAAILEGDALGKLGLRLEIGVDAEEAVVHHHAEVARDVGRGPDRVQHGQVGVRDEFQRPRAGRLGDADARQCGAGDGAGDQGASMHSRLPRALLRWPVRHSEARKRQRPQPPCARTLESGPVRGPRAADGAAVSRAPAQPTERPCPGLRRRSVLSPFAGPGTALVSALTKDPEQPGSQPLRRPQNSGSPFGTSVRVRR